MDPNQVAPDQLPDENYIERLFPKCQPKQANMYSSSSTNSIHNNGANSSNTNKRSFKSSGGKDIQRKQTRSKVQQHSRRELEARRNKIIKSSLSHDIDANSSETSDDNKNNKNIINNSSHNNNSIDSISNNPSRNSKKGLNSRYLNSNKLSASSKLPQNLLTNNASPSRKSSKYTASQNLLQQLKRSQSSYSNNTGNLNTTTLLDEQKQNTTPNRREVSDKSSGNVYHERGIVKSTSSFVTFLDEPRDAHASRQPTQLSSSKVQQIQQRGSLDETNKPNSNAKNDNTPTNDLVENISYNYATNRPSILRNPKRDILDNNTPLYSTNRTSTNNDTIERLASKIVNGQSELMHIETSVGDKKVNSDRDKLFEDKLEPASVNIPFVETTTTNLPTHTLCAQNNTPSATAVSSSSLLSSPSRSTTATTIAVDSSFRDKNNYSKREHLAGVDDNFTNSSSTNLNQTTVSCDDKSISDDPVKKQDANVEPNRKDDDKYINLFVYDNITNHHPQKGQLFPQVATSPSYLSKQLQETQQPPQYQGSFPPSQHKRSARYRPSRLSRLPGKTNESSNFSDESFESLKDNIEITEIIEEDENINQNSEPVAVNSGEVKESTPKHSSAPPLNCGNNNSSLVDHLTSNKYLPNVENKSPNIISVHHQASQQLLTTSDANENDDNVLRNDTSTEELCSINDVGLEEDTKRRKGVDVNRYKTQDIDFSTHLAKSQQDDQQETSNIITNKPIPMHHRALTPISTLQTVDERAEINIESEFDLKNQAQNNTEIDSAVSDKMPANQPGSTRKCFVPPGYPQRIGALKQPLQVLNEDGSIKNNTLPQEKETLRPLSANANAVIGCNPEKFTNNKIGGDNARESELGTSSNVSPRVKFDDDNLVTVRDDFIEPSVTQVIPAFGNSKHNITTYIGTRGGGNDEQLSQLPSINENQFESEIDTSKNNLDASERDLSIDLNKISLVSHPCNQNGIPCYVNSTHPDTLEAIFQQQQAIREKVSMNIHQTESDLQINSSDILQHRQQQQQQQQLRTNSLDNSRTSQVSAYETSLTNPGSNLRHHKLPNETSHYSIVRSSGFVGETTSNTSATARNNFSNDNNNFITRSSSLRFNTLSDNESGPEDSAVDSNKMRQISTNGSINKKFSVTMAATPAKKCDPILASNSSVARNNLPGVSSMKNSSIINDDDMMPTTKTALIFPRLDEGLSSDAESGDDEVEEEDERAVDADVDADDDDDDDEDDDDDDEDNDDEENNIISINKGPSSVRQSSVECYPRQQQQQPPKINRLSNAPQQHPSLGLLTGDQTDLHQVKAPVTSYGGYISQDQLEHNDLKTMTNYSNQNGQSNYWMGVAGHQQSTLNSSQSSSSQQQQFIQRTSHNSNSFNRDEGKISNRLSSDTDNETDRLLGSQRNDQLKLANSEVNGSNSTDLQPISSNMIKQNASSKEVLIEGVLFNVKYLGSTHSDCEGRSEKEDRIHQAEMAVQEVKFRNGESQSATEVQLFISTEKIMVLDDKHRKILMDHSLRTISYIADIGDAIVLIVRKKNSSSDVTSDLGRPISKISCHVFESIESHTITKSISQAFQVAYTELLKANGTGDTSSYLPKEIDYQEVLNSQEMSTDELEMFARKENQREVIVPKDKGEILGVSIVESGWGSVLPTVVIANLKPDGPAFRCKRLSIGDQILSVNGISLVGLPLAECQEIIRKTKNQRVAKLSVVPCPITVEVKIKRPDTKYQLGFSVQNGVICSLLRGGIAERGGVRVGHRIMSINGTTVVGVPHEKIVTLLASSVGEIRMKTCLTSLYRLILGEENPVHF